MTDEHPNQGTSNGQGVSAKTSAEKTSEPLDAGWLKQLVLDAGADDVGFVEIGRPALDDQRQDILKAFSHARTLISFVVRMNREAIRTPARSVSNNEFHHTGDEVNEIARSVVQTLEDQGIRAMNPTMGFPMVRNKGDGDHFVMSQMIPVLFNWSDNLPQVRSQIEVPADHVSVHRHPQSILEVRRILLTQLTELENFPSAGQNSVQKGVAGSLSEAPMYR